GGGGREGAGGAGAVPAALEQAGQVHGGGGGHRPAGQQDGQAVLPPHRPEDQVATRRLAPCPAPSGPPPCCSPSPWPPCWPPTSPSPPPRSAATPARRSRPTPAC